jgi:transcription antitermination factor NusG
MRQAAARLVKLTQDEEAAALRELARQSMPQMPRIDEAYRIGPARWFAVYTAPRMEGKVIEGLERQNLVSYMPIAATWKKQSAREKHQREPKMRIERPVWPRYVFVALPVEMRVTDDEKLVIVPFGELRRIFGILDIVGDGTRPLQIADEFIAGLLLRQADGDFDDTIRRGRRIVVPKWAHPNIAVTIKRGPFAGFNGIIEELLPHEIAKVCVFIFGRETPIEIEIDRIKPL